MLRDCLNHYENVADTYLSIDWRKANKNELCYKCCEYENKDNRLYNAYFSALIVRYWHLIAKNAKQARGAYNEYDCYNWLVDSIVSTITTKLWLNPESTLYKDPLAPDKSINVRMKSHRQGFYQWSNCEKRADSITKNRSMETLFEDCGDSAFPVQDDISHNIDSELTIKDLIVREFNKKNYMGSFIVYGIVNADVFDRVFEGQKSYTKFNKKKLSSFVRHLDSSFCTEFSNVTKLSKEDVKIAVEKCKGLSRVRVYTIIDNTLASLPKKLAK